MAYIHSNRVRCRYCSKQVHPAEASGNERRGYQCQACGDWHAHALEVLAGADPLGCYECHTSWAELKAANVAEQLKAGRATGEVRLYVVPKDGMYQLLCQLCCDAYVPKRRDHWSSTEFGHSLNL